MTLDAEEVGVDFGGSTWLSFCAAIVTAVKTKIKPLKEMTKSETERERERERERKREREGWSGGEGVRVRAHVHIATCL